jgi:predicted PurR-regulated permease PerM
MHAMDRLASWAGRYVDLSSFDLRGALLRWLEQISRSLLSWGAWAASNIISFVADTVITLFTLFFLFREGGSMREHAETVLPLNASQVERLFTGLSNSIVANV